MKSFYLLIAAVSVFSGVEAANSSTVTCSACSPGTTADEIVTREPIPTPDCTAPALTIITNPANGSSPGVHGPSNPIMSPTPTNVPVSAAGMNIAGSMTGLLALGAAAVYLM